MADYLFDQDIYTSISNLKKIATEYENKISDIQDIIKEITLSDDWEDLQVKTSCLGTLNSYMTIYGTLLGQMNFMIQKLENKSDKFDSLESTFS